MLKPSIVDRYLFAECAKTWLGVAAVMVVLTLGVGFARFIAEAAAGQIPAAAILTVAGYSVLQNLEIVLPVSVLLAILLTVGRLCRDNEMAALAAGGVGLARLYRPLGLFALLLALLVAWLSLVVAPQAGRSLQQLRAAGAAVMVQSIEAGRFIVLDDGNAVFYAGQVQPDGTMRDVFIRVDLEKEGAEAVVTAARADYQVDASSGAQTLVLHQGFRYQGTPGQADYRVTGFAEHGVQVGPGAVDLDYDLEDIPSAALYARDDAAAVAELRGRLAVPLSLLVLAVLAVPLGQQPPRAGRYSKLVLGILIYVGYANALRLGELWLANGDVPRVLGLWWIHALMLALGAGLIARRLGYFRLRRWRRAAGR